MSAPSLNPDKMTPVVVALFDRMSDGQWHDNKALINFGADLCIQEEREDALKNGRRVRRKSIASGTAVSDDDLIASGAKDLVRNRLMIAVRGNRLERTKTHHRMTEETRLAWLAVRPHATSSATRGHLSAVPTISAAPEAATTSGNTDTNPGETATATNRAALTLIEGGSASQHIDDDDAEDAEDATRNRNAERTFAGILESEGWAAAPLELKSRVHFKVENDEIPLAEFRADLPAGTKVTYDEGTGLYRVDCDHGTGNEIRDFIRDWCDTRGMKAKSLRAEHDVRRRDINTLDPQFFSELCVAYSEYSKRRVSKHHSTLQYHYSDSDDIGQQVYLWIIEAAERYDNESGVPFGAFLSTRIQVWVHDLNRNKYGRQLSDTELKYQRAMQEFTTANGRKPTEAELAAAMGQEIGIFRKNAQIVSVLQGLRNAGTLDVAPGENEIALPDEDFADDRYNDEMTQSLLSQVLTVSCGVDEDARGKLATKPNVLGWVAMYESVWGQKTKTELSNGLSTSMRNMNEYTARVEERMKRTGPSVLGG